MAEIAETDPVALMRCVASILPKEIDAKLSVDVDLFREQTSFMQAYRLARQMIGADPDDTLLIEAEDETEAEA
jgi:hypothetical protein